MAKSDKQKVYDTSMSQIPKIEEDYGKATDTLGSRSNETWDRGTSDYDNAAGSYKNFLDTGGITPDQLAALQRGGGGVSNPLAGLSSNYAGISSAFANAYRPDYGESDAGYRKMAGAGGGFDADKLNQIYGNIDQLTDYGKTGGITDSDVSNVNRQPLLDFEQNGGYDDNARAMVRAKSAASSPAYFGAMKDNMQRMRGITNNLAGAGKVDFKLARQQAQQQGQDRLNAEIGLNDSIRTGRMDASKFLSGQNLQLAGLRSGNQINAANLAAGQGTDLQKAITANQLSGLGGLASSQTNLGEWGLGQAGGLDQFALTKAGGLDQFQAQQAAMQQSADSANSSRADADARWALEYGNANKQWATEGLSDLYKTNLGASQNYSAMGLDALNDKYGNTANMLNLASANRGTTLGERAGTYGKLAAAGAATALTAGAASPALAAAMGVGGLSGGTLAGLGAAASFGSRNIGNNQPSTFNPTDYYNVGSRPQAYY